MSLLGVHNWFFGWQFVPMTQAGFIPENLTAPPRVYRAGLLGDREARAQAFEHLWGALDGAFRSITGLARFHGCVSTDPVIRVPPSVGGAARASRSSH